MNCPHCNKPIALGSLSREELASLRGQINAAMRTNKGGGPKITCTCGSCATCRKREAMRKYRANRLG